MQSPFAFQAGKGSQYVSIQSEMCGGGDGRGPRGCPVSCDIWCYRIFGQCSILAEFVTEEGLFRDITGSISYPTAASIPDSKRTSYVARILHASTNPSTPQNILTAHPTSN